jgi:hypothetical protein
VSFSRRFSRQLPLGGSGHPGQSIRPTRRCVFLVQLLNLLLHLAAKFQRMRDLVKWLGSPARPSNDSRTGYRLRGTIAIPHCILKLELDLGGDFPVDTFWQGQPHKFTRWSFTLHVVSVVMGQASGWFDAGWSWWGCQNMGSVAALSGPIPLPSVR